MELFTPANAREYRIRDQGGQANMNRSTAFTLGGIALAAWIGLTFLLAIPSGWVHLPLAAAVLLFVKGIVEDGGDRG